MAVIGRSEATVSSSQREVLHTNQLRVLQDYRASISLGDGNTGFASFCALTWPCRLSLAASENQPSREVVEFLD
jgi:hypothetical protein